MKKRFRFKKSKGSILKIIILFIIIFLIFKLCSLFISKLNLYPNDSRYIKYILADSNSYMINKESNILDYVFENFNNYNLNKPVTLLMNTCSYIEEPNDTILVYNENFDENIQPVINNNSKPLVYIFNTHPTEGFNDDELNVHNITPTIRAMSDVLKEKLEELGVPTYVEQGDVSAYLKDNNLHYNNSYKGSTLFLKEFLEQNDSVKLYIDLHRDGVAYKNSVTTIDGKKYAKVMFVIGGGHVNYDSTLNASTKLNNYFKEKYPSLTRGLYPRPDCAFNQDTTENMVLIELGGNENNVSEVLNTIDILAESIKEYIYEN